MTNQIRVWMPPAEDKPTFLKKLRTWWFVWRFKRYLVKYVRTTRILLLARKQMTPGQADYLICETLQLLFDGKTADDVSAHLTERIKAIKEFYE